MEVTYALSQRVIPMGSPATTELLITFKSETNAVSSARRPLNLSLVIDRSGSMAGNPLRHALQAAAALVDQLTSEDVLSIVVYDDNIATVLPPQYVIDKAAIHDAIARVRAGGCTNLSGGWLKGCDHVQETQGRDMIRRVLLLTDGQANAGLTDAAVLIDAARQKAQTGIITTTLGFGTNFNEDLLIGMSRAAGGNFYFIQTPEDAEDVFRIELESLKSVAAQNLTVTLHPVGEVVVNGLLNNYRTTTNGNDFTISVGDVYENEAKLLGLEIAMPASSSVGVLDLFRLSYAYDAAIDGSLQHATGETQVQTRVGTLEEAISAPPATDVIQQFSKLVIARAKDEAIALADKGSYADAAQMLRAVVADMRSKGLHESFEIAEDLDQLDHFAERIESRSFDSTSRKEMRDQSYQAQSRNRGDLSLRGLTAGSARTLEAIKEADVAGKPGALVKCYREGGKLRVKVISDGYDPNLNVQFPRSIREEGITYLVEELRLSTDGGFYHSTGKIQRVVLPGQENMYADANRRSSPKSSGKPASVKGSAADLDTTDTVGEGVMVQCVKEGSKLRARVVSDGFDPNWNMRFPRDIREEGMLYVVDEVVEVAGGGQYLACGKIRRFIQK